MKGLTLLFSLFFPLLLIGQVSGNYNKSRKGNYNHRNNANTANIKAKNNFPSARWSGSRLVELEVNALSNQKADAYVVIFSLRQLGKTAEEADRLLKDRYNSFNTAALGLGIKQEDIYMDMISFVPVYEYEEEKKLFSKKTYNEIPKGFEIQQNVHVKYTNPDVLVKLVSIAAKQEIYDIVKVDYFVENIDAVYEELRKKAIEYLNKEVNEFEKLGMLWDGAERIFTEDESAMYPLNRYSTYTAFSSQSLETNAKNRVQNMDKSTTMFYDKIPYDDFEIIINPTIVEPAVHFMYNLKLQIQLKSTTPKVEVKREREFVWLTPDGELKTLKVEKSK